MKPYRQRTYYELLEVDQTACTEEIRFAYKRATELPATTCAAHYGLAAPAQLEDLRKLLLEAMEILSDADLRSEYDRTLGLSTDGPSASEEGEGLPAQLAMSEILSVRPLQDARGQSAVDGGTPGPVDAVSAPEPTSARSEASPREATDGAAAAAPLAAAQIRPRPKGIPADAEFNGELLREIRESRGLTLNQVCEKTRIAVRHLENVEADRYDALPATVYLRGIVMSLARELKLDPLRVARSYLGLVAAAKERQK